MGWRYMANAPVGDREMTRPIHAIALVVAFLSLTTMAWADHGQSHVDVQADNETGVLSASADQATDPGSANSSTDSTTTQTNQPVDTGPQPEYHYQPVCQHGDTDIEGSAFGCPSGELLGCGDGGETYIETIVYPDDRPTESSTVCIEPGDPVPEIDSPPVDIPGAVLAAFKKVPLPESTIEVEPPGGRTLVNFRTLLFTPAAVHQIPVKLEAVDVDIILEVSPDHFLWHHGDDSTQETTIAGTKWSEGVDVSGPKFVSHIYTDTFDDVPVSVDTTWSAKYQIAGETVWKPVNGTVTKVGEPINLEVLEATPQLVENPY